MSDWPGRLVFDATMEQRLLNAHQEWLAQQHQLVVKWCEAQDLLIGANLVATLGLSVVVFMLAMRVHQLSGDKNG